MEDQITIDTSTAGRSFDTDDINTLGEVSSKVDDHVLAELFPMAPWNGSSASKGVLSPQETSIVSQGSTTRTVVVNAFRAFIGSRTATTSDPLVNILNYRDIRSGIFMGEGATAAGPTSVPWGTTILLAANTSGNPRIDVVYAKVSIDNIVSNVRYQKSLTTAVVSAANLPIKKQTLVSVGVVTGTPGVSPVAPSLPTDGTTNAFGGTDWYVPLAQLTCPDSFTAPSVISQTAPILPASFQKLKATLATGSALVAPAGATVQYQSGSTLQQLSGSNATFAGSATFSGTTVLSGAVKFGYRTVATDASLNGTRTITMSDGPVVDGSGITAGRSWTLDPTGANHGQVITILNNSTTNAITLSLSLVGIGSTTISIWRNASNTWSETFIYDGNAAAFQQLWSSPT